MEHHPPPLFKQGMPALVKMVIFSIIAVLMFIADSHFRLLKPIRYVINAALYPVQRLASLPIDAAGAASDYFSSLSSTKEEIRELRRQRLLEAQTLQKQKLLESENERLRALLELKGRQKNNSIAVEILHDARDRFTRKIIVDKGERSGVREGQPVIDDMGIAGQVTSVFPFNSEVTLLTDKDQTIPVFVERSGLRGVLFGMGQSGMLEMRFVPSDSDLQEGDLLTTSGIDGIYPEGLSVAKISKIERTENAIFMRVFCLPTAKIEQHKHLLVLLVDTKKPLPPIESVNPNEKNDKRTLDKKSSEQKTKGEKK